MQLNPPKHRYSEKNNRKAIKTPDLGAKLQVWLHWQNHFENTKKVTQLKEQVIAM